MFKRILNITIAIALGLPVGQAHAQALRCESVFAVTPRDVLEVINKENAEYLFKGKSLDQFQSELSWARRRKVRRLLQNIQLDNVPSQKAMENYAIELGSALFGRKDSLGRWFTENGAQRLDESTTLIIKEQLLKDGLVKVWGDQYDPANFSRFRKFTDAVWRFQHSRFMEFAGIPYWLPSVKDSAISKELMFKVIRDGYTKNQKEIEVALKSQNARDAYNTFKRYYSPIVFAILFIVTADEAKDQYYKMIDDQVNALIKSLQEQRSDMDKSMSDVKVEEGKAAYKAALAAFAEKWGEPPTAEENQVIQSSIEQALGLPKGSVGQS